MVVHSPREHSHKGGEEGEAAQLSLGALVPHLVTEGSHKGGVWVGRRVRGVSGVSTVSNAPPTCCWDVVVTIRVLERRAQWKMSVLTFSSRSVGRETAETSQEVNKWRSSEKEVAITESMDGKLVHTGHPVK